MIQKLLQSDDKPTGTGSERYLFEINKYNEKF